ncbi:MAG: hypothetical protein WC552_04555 [Candidatus Omnitrophota bacterium]
MTFINGCKKYFSSHLLAVFLCLSFALWIFLFRGFLFGNLDVSSDAIPYYEHTRFYLENLKQGVFPLWNPTWDGGSTNDFFLRRIGDYNPFLLLILLLNSLGLSFYSSYFSYYAFYFFLGMVGFYLLAKRLLKDTRIAFVAYLLLLFSSLGTRILDSYIILVAVPMAWFFYFLIAFFQEQQKKFLLGMTFSMMILLTTYIPFYFVTIVLGFLISFCLVYPDQLGSLILRLVGFVRKNKIFFIFCVAAVLLALIPGLMFYRDASRGEFVVPLRHGTDPGNALVVHTENILNWATLEDLIFSHFFIHTPRFQMAVLYVPIFSYLLLLLGVLTAIQRRTFLFFVLGSIFFLLSMPKIVPVYDFLYKHVFWFKLFRNLHFFLWLVILPVFILFIADQFRVFLDLQPSNKKQRYLLLGFVIAAHAGLIAFLFSQEGVILSTYLVAGLSLIFFFLYFHGWFKNKRAALFFALFLLVVLQPIEAYYYFAQNITKDSGPYRYDRPYLDFSFFRDKRDAFSFDDNAPPQVYFGGYWYDFLLRNTKYEKVKDYLWHKFVVYDYTKKIDEENFDFREIEDVFRDNRNLAFVWLPDPSASLEEEVIRKRIIGRNMFAKQLSENTDEFQVVSFNSNMLKIKTNFSARKFLVYNDTYHSKWRASINGRKADLYRANVAFKGLWLPPGENLVVLSFGTKGQYCFNVFFLLFFDFVLIYLLWLGIKR